jgi:23S rRNA pseudouridine2605 synthase
VSRAAPRGSLSLARALSKFGVCSRSQARRLIEAGRVRVNGRVLKRPEARLEPGRDRVDVDGRRVGDPADTLAIALHKPVGYVTTRTDPGGRPTVYDLLTGLRRWVFPVGRLDRDSAGLLVLTNDHRLGERLTSPAAHVPKTYHLRVRGVPDDAALRVLAEGVPLHDGLTRPARVRALGAAKDGSAWLEVTLTEGRNRQLRRMCAAVGHDVLDLVRVAIGGLSLGELGLGRWRRLEAAEIESLAATGAQARRRPGATMSR